MIKAGLLSTLDKIVRINWDTVTTNTTRRIVSHKSEGLGSCAINDVFDVDTKTIKGTGDFVDEGDIDVTEGILENFDGLCFTDWLS